MSGDVRQALRELHDDYVWRVNAAVGEGRPDSSPGWSRNTRTPPSGC